MNQNNNLKEIYLAGGCFWGTEKYLANISGIVETNVGYANGNTEYPTYEDVCHHNTGHSEAVKVLYNPLQISLEYVLSLYYDVINPTSVNRQGNDIGSQYRSGIYYVDTNDKETILKSIKELQTKFDKPIAIEVLPLQNYYIAEEYHQKYLDKNPQGYCHIGVDKFEKAKLAKDESIPLYKPTPKSILKDTLSELQYNVTQKSATEPSFQNEYYNQFESGIYVDITTGEPLFVSSDKFESGCGWPSFSKPIDNNLIVELSDSSLIRERTEVRSKTGDAHLGHVFNDGPEDKDGLRYCINSASLKFIPKNEMPEKGYANLLILLDK